MQHAGFWLYIFFIISWFTHLTSRISFLGAIRFDLAIVIILFFLSIFGFEQKNASHSGSEINKALKYLIAYSILTIPFVEWPGSVLNHGIPTFIKAVVFYFFTVLYVNTEKKLKIFVSIFLACQTFRILEPLYLHITQGYWGSRASMANWEFMNRLAGAPYDIVNPNGLAFIIDTVFSFIYFLAPLQPAVLILFLLLLVPLFLYALVLTGSRSGLLGFAMLLILIWYRSKHKLLFLGVVLLCGCLTYPHLTPDQKDRYLSIFSKNTKNAATAQGRTHGVIMNFEVALRKPFCGHGLGTSQEANANFGHSDQPAHNLYAEVTQELGFVGLVLFFYYIKSIISVFKKGNQIIQARISTVKSFNNQLWFSLQVFFGMNLLLSLASYGISSYEWYLLPGLTEVLFRQVNETAAE